MSIKNQPLLTTMKQGGLTFRFLEFGDVYDIRFEHDQINLFKGNSIDGMPANIYLRVHDNSKIHFTPLLGVKSNSDVQIHDDHVIYQGRFENIKYQVVLRLDAFTWTYAVKLEAPTARIVDLMYGQDIGINHEHAILNNEAYNAQYVDIKAFEHDGGYTLCARQNEGRAQLVQIGCKQTTRAFSTDGFQFFGLSVKETGQPDIMEEDHLANFIEQYEFTYLALQTNRFKLDQTHDIVFYGHYVADHPDIITKPRPIKLTAKNEAWHQVPLSGTDAHMLDVKRRINGRSPDERHFKEMYASFQHIESRDGLMLSFFTRRHHHVVLNRKEVLVKRPHGQIIVHGDVLQAGERVMTVTHFMTGLFASHVALGNNQQHKLISSLRSAQDLFKTAGLRIYVKLEGIYRLLGMPSYYDMGSHTARWVYIISGDVILIDVFALADSIQQTLTIESLEGRTYEFIVTCQLVMGQHPYMYDIPTRVTERDITIFVPKEAMAAAHYPRMKYRISSSQDWQSVSEEDAFGCTSQHGLLIMSFARSDNIRLDIQATLEDRFEPLNSATYDIANQEGTRFYATLSPLLSMKHPTEQARLDQLTTQLFWYAQNAMVHYASPHGLEQFNGAAWGTRDVCQGPIECFMAIQRMDIVRDILLKVYKRQFLETGDFPQWFMAEQYHTIQSHHSHGDIIIWPLRALVRYLSATNDFSILEETIPYFIIKDNDFGNPHTLLHHIEHQIDAIKSNVIAGTHLPAYGGGDWDDTLQPANPAWTTKMVSGWTTALLYETIRDLAAVLAETHQDQAVEARQLADAIKDDYHAHILKDDIPAGFVIFESAKKYLLHPRDKTTGLRYRLLPLVRAMIAELTPPELLDTQIDIIDQHLNHPDGVRLMDAPVKYHHGQKTYFSRAETAANFGREIGLQYVHAHIRYLEAMANINKADVAYEDMFKIMPILLNQKVRHAVLRQSNVYFSSSDADFATREHARLGFGLIKESAIPVKGGWRLYSSGPGIFIGYWIWHALGIRIHADDLFIRPSVPRALDGLVIDFMYRGHPLRIQYHEGPIKVMIDGRLVTFISMTNRYGMKGHRIPKNMLRSKDTVITIDIWFEATDKQAHINKKAKS